MPNYLEASEVCIALNISKSVLLHWEKKGLYSVPRTRSGRRLYDEQTVALIKKIATLRSDGLTIPQIQEKLHG